MPGAPQLIVGKVMHRRLRPVEHAFVYPVFCVRLPVHDLTAANSRWFSVDRANLLSFHQSDHGLRDGSPLLPWMRTLLRERGLPADGEIVLQTFPRVLGFVFNPVSFWYCYDAAAEPIAVLAEVNNTFGGRHAYLLHHPDGTPLRDGQVFTAGKEFHVSPFNDVTGGYSFRFFFRRTHALTRIDYDDGRGPLLLTAISGRSLAWSDANLLRTFLRMPFLTIGVVARIHWQALRLWLKGAPFIGARPHSAAHSLEEPTK